MYQLYYAPRSAAMAPHMVLSEIGADYELVLTEVDKNKPRDPAFLALNPNGWVPVLIDENGAIHESAAIVIYLADRYPEAGLAPAPNHPDRGRFLQWMVYMADCLQVAYQMNYYPERHSTESAHVPAIQAKADERLTRVWGYIAGAMEPGPYLLGERFSACDLYVYMLSTWHPRGRWLLDEFPAIARCAELVVQRPAVQRILPTHGLGSTAMELAGNDTT